MILHANKVDPNLLPHNINLEIQPTTRLLMPVFFFSSYILIYVAAYLRHITMLSFLESGLVLRVIYTKNGHLIVLILFYQILFFPLFIKNVREPELGM